MMNIETVNINSKLSQFSDYWNPRIAGELNGQLVKLAKLKGDFVWHSHEHEDEMFLVLKGTLKIELRNKMLTIREHEFVIIPRGVEHKPIADEEVSIMLFEPASTVNTGAIDNELTKKELEKI